VTPPAIHKAIRRGRQQQKMIVVIKPGSKYIVLYFTGYGTGYFNINGRPVGLEPLQKPMARTALPAWWKNTSALCRIVWWGIVACMAWWEMRSLLFQLPLSFTIYNTAA